MLQGPAREQAVMRLLCLLRLARRRGDRAAVLIILGRLEGIAQAWQWPLP